MSIRREHHCRLVLTTTPARELGAQILDQIGRYLLPTGRATGTGKYPVRDARFAKHMTPQPETVLRHIETDATAM